jgi:hypothetical protein
VGRFAEFIAETEKALSKGIGYINGWLDRNGSGVCTHRFASDSIMVENSR